MLSVSFGGCVSQGHISPEGLPPPPDSNVSINCKAVTNGVGLTGNTPTAMGELRLLMGAIKRLKSLWRWFYTTVPLPSAALRS